MLFGRDKLRLPTPDEARPGRAERPFYLTGTHTVLGTTIEPPFPDGLARAVVGMGCFWGAERRFWLLDGVVTTAAGYAGGHTPHPTYEEVCSGHTGHTEVVLVVFDPQKLPWDEVWRSFWEGHDPTQGMRQGNDVGTQYRSAIYVADSEALAGAEAGRAGYQRSLAEAGHGEITTEIAQEPAFYYAEEHHQQYLDKNPDGYCGLGGTGVTCPIGLPN